MLKMGLSANAKLPSELVNLEAIRSAALVEVLSKGFVALVHDIAYPAAWRLPLQTPVAQEGVDWRNGIGAEIKCDCKVLANDGVMYDTTWPRPVMTPVAKEEELNVGRALMERGRRLFWFRITKPFEVEANEIGPAELA